MLEVERKFLEVDVPEMQDILFRLGAEKIYEGDIIVRRYVAVNDETQKLRLRYLTTTGMIECTKKKKFRDRDGKKMKNEEETSWHGSYKDFVQHGARLQSEGMILRDEADKHRESWRLGNKNYEFDTITDPIWIPTYLEVEVDDPSLIDQAVHELGLSMDDAKTWSMWKLIEKYRGKRAGILADDFTVLAE